MFDAIRFLNNLSMRGIPGTRIVALGDQTPGDIYFVFANGDIAGSMDTVYPGLRWLESAKRVEFSPDGTVWSPLLKIGTAATEAAAGNHGHGDTYAPKEWASGSSYAAGNHTHSEYAATNHNHNDAYAPKEWASGSSYASSTHNHDTSYAALNHTHSDYLTALTLAGILDDPDTGYVTMATFLAHGHEGYALESELSNYSPTNHTHSQYLTEASLGDINTALESLLGHPL
jgi:hypothetical protein